MKKPQCIRCGRVLSDPYSIAVGMGPECRGEAKKRGAKFPKAKWHVSGGRVVFDGLQGKVELPAVNTGAVAKRTKVSKILEVNNGNENESD